MLENLLSSGHTILYGRQYTYQCLKQAGLPMVRDGMFQILKDIDPAGVAGRRLHLNTRP